MKKLCLLLIAGLLVLSTACSNSAVQNAGKEAKAFEGVASTSSSTSGEVLYEGIPLSQFFVSSIDEIVAALGTPDIHDEYKLSINDIDFYLYERKIETAESFSPGKFTMDGATLDKNRAELIALLGNPSYECEDSSGFEMTFERDNYTLTIATGDHEGTAWRVFISPNGGSSDLSPSEVLYKGIPIGQLFEMEMDNVVEILGEPSYDGYYNGGRYYAFNNEIGFVFNEDTHEIIVIETGMPSAITVDVETLDKNRAGLTDMLGDNGYEEEFYNEMDDEYEYSMEYVQYGNYYPFIIKIIMPDENSKASQVLFFRYEDGISDEEYWDGINNSESSSSGNSNSLPAGTYWFFTNSLKQNTSTGNVYIAPLEMTTEHFIKYVNILNPDKLDRGVSSIKIKIVSDKNFMGYASYDIVDSRNTVYTVVDVKIVD